jgi:putative SOS response-associated peptidase YedK
MCYSAMVNARARELARRFGAMLDYDDGVGLYTRRLTDSSIKIPKAWDANFDSPATPAERKIRDLIQQYRTQQATALEQQLFAQRKRLADAERKLKDKETKAALESKRIATSKVEQFTSRLADLTRTEPKPRDSRIFPFGYAPIILEDSGKRTIQLARYHCRQAGKPASIDRERDGLYNARRDNIDRFWRKEFGQTHALWVVTSFFENVERDGKNAVLQFEPRPAQDMLIACVYSRWTGPKGETLLSFAAITDEPPPEVVAAGHDRVIINLKEENVDAWLSPNGRTDAELQSILGDPQRPFYEHRALAA